MAGATAQKWRNEEFSSGDNPSLESIVRNRDPNFVMQVFKNEQDPKIRMAFYLVAPHRAVKGVQLIRQAEEWVEDNGGKWRRIRATSLHLSSVGVMKINDFKTNVKNGKTWEEYAAVNGLGMEPIPRGDHHRYVLSWDERNARRVGMTMSE